LARHRRRAAISTVGGLAVTLAVVGLIPIPDHYRIEGVVEPARLALIHAKSDGFVTSFLPSESVVSPDGAPLIEAVNPKLEARSASLRAKRRALEVRQRMAELEEIAGAQIVAEQIAALDETVARVESELDDLCLRAPFEGTWVAPQIERTQGTYLHRGDHIGFVGSLDDLIVRATAGQDVAAMVFEQADNQVEIRVEGWPNKTFSGRIEKILPAGQEELPSEALGYAAGGSTPTRPDMTRGQTAAERFFEVRIRPTGKTPLLTGQRVVARVCMSPKPLLVQWYQLARRLFQRRFRI